MTVQQSQFLIVDRDGMEYINMNRDFEVNEEVLEQILDTHGLQHIAVTVSPMIENQNARILDRATPPRKPLFPNHLLNLGLGAFGGLTMGLILAFSVAYFDDRIKSAFDIETVIGLPLLGIIPEIKHNKRLKIQQ